MSNSFWLDQSSSHSSRTYDLVVVGAGIAGLSTVYWLQKEDPSLKIALLDKGELASGATGRNAGFITCGSVEHYNRLVERWGPKEAYEIWKFSEDNLDLLRQEIFPSLISSPLEELGFEDRGSFSLASTSSELEELKKTAQLMSGHSVDVETLNALEVRSRLGVEGFDGGVKYVHDASVHPVYLCEKLKSFFKGDLFFNTEVGTIDVQGDTRLIKTNKGDFETSAVVLAMNGYLPSLDSFFSDKVFPTRGQILAVEAVDPFMEGPCYANFVLDYFRQVPTGEVLVGGFRQLEKETEVGYSDHTTDKIQSALYQFLQDHLPQLKNKKITHRWAGVMGFSADGQPFVGAKVDDPQVYYLGGFTAHGLGLAFHSAKCLVDLMYGRDLPEIISARRFSS